MPCLKTLMHPPITSFGSVLNVDLSHSLNEPLQSFSSHGSQRTQPLKELSEEKIDEDGLEEEMNDKEVVSNLDGDSLDITLASNGLQLTPFERRWGALFLP